MTTRDVLKGWDFWAAFAVAVAAWLLLPSSVSNALALSLYDMGITVLSVIFAIFYAALTVIIATSDDQFVAFLKGVGVYTRIIATYRFTLILLFLALMYSVLAFAWTAVLKEAWLKQGEYVLVGFAFLFFYALFAVMYSTHDAIEYAKRRIDYTEAIKEARGPQPGT